MGVYGFSGSVAGYRQRLSAWCGELEDGSLLMAHAAASAAPVDPIVAARLIEHEVLGSPAFDDCFGKRLTLVRLSQVLQRDLPRG